MVRLLLGLTLLIYLSSVADTSDMVKFDSYKKVGDHPLVVVNASTKFNKREKGKRGIDKLIKSFKNSNREVYYLHSEKYSMDLEDKLNNRYIEDKEPTELFYSYGGENNLISKSSEITVAGGFLGSGEDQESAFQEFGGVLEGCLTSAISSLIKNHFDHYK
jgi:hypothetical protein